LDIAPIGHASKTASAIKPVCQGSGAGELHRRVSVGIVRRMGAVKRACLRLGAAATMSLLLSLAVMMFLVEAPQVGTWFLASSALGGAAYATAVVAAYFEQ
jgi:hypothetical protein